MPLSFADLTTPETDAEAIDRLVDLLELEGFQASAWQPGTVPRELVSAEGRSEADQIELIARLAESGFLDTAAGPWLTLLARSDCQVTRKPDEFTRGKVLLTDGGGGPHTIDAGDLIVGDALDRKWISIEDVVVPENGSIEVLVEAESPGAAWNVPNGSISVLHTTYPTLSVSNPGPPGASWITQQGADEEDDPSLRTRCKARWPQLGKGATALAYQGWALEASLQVRRVRTPSPPGDGTVPIVIAGPSGAVDSTVVDAVAAYLESRAPQGVRPVVSSVVDLVVPVAGLVYVRKAYAAAALTTILKGLEALQAELQSSGETLYREALIEVLMSPRGARNCTLTAPLGNVTPSSIQALILQPSITITGV